MTTKINPLEHVPVPETITVEPVKIRLAGVELPIEQIGVGGLAYFDRSFGDKARAFLGEKVEVEITKDDERDMAAVIIGLAVVEADNSVDFHSFVESVKHVARWERELAVKVIGDVTFPNYVVESAEGKAPAPAKTIAAGPKPKTRKKAAKATA